MNLALHGFLLQVLLSILNLQHSSLLCSAGEPGYLDFDNLPETNFSCQGKVIGGYYADVEAGCQMFHVCTIGQKDEIMDIKFLCLNGTVFDQETRVCERVDEVDCSKSERFYNLNLELYGNNAVTLSLHENSEDEIDSSDQTDDHQRTTSARPTTTTTTTTTTSKPNKPSTTPSSSSFSHPTGYPQHFQPQPPFPQVHTSQSKSLYDDKNGGYHHQYIFHNGERSNNQQATSYQLFSNQGVSSTTVQAPQVHQIRFSSTSSPQIIHNEPSTVSPLFHATSSTIQTLLNSNGNSPALINPIFHNHGIASTTEQFSIHSNNPREASEYRSNSEQSIRPLDPVQSTNKGKVSKLTISPVPTAEPPRSIQTKTSSQSSQQSRISGNFLSTPSPDETTVRSFYPTPRTSSKSSQSSQSTSEQVTQHIHVLPPVQIPQLKPHQITINLPPPDLQRIVQNPSSLLPSQSRVIVTAKASVSDESGRPLNTTQLVTLPLPTIPASYDDYKEGDESFDPFYRDVPKIRNGREVIRRNGKVRGSLRSRRSVGQTKNSMVSFVNGEDSRKKQDTQVKGGKKDRNKEKMNIEERNKDFKSIKESLMKFRDILFGGEFTEDTIRSVFEGSRLQLTDPDGKVRSLTRDSLEDLETKASKNFKAKEYEDETEEDAKKKKNDKSEGIEIPLQFEDKPEDDEEYDFRKESDSSEDEEEFDESERKDEEEEEEEVEEEEEEEEEETKEEDSEEKSNFRPEKEEKSEERDIDIVILDPNEYLRMKSANQDTPSTTTEEEQVSTEIPVFSTTSETTEATTVDRPEEKQDSEGSKAQDETVKESRPFKKVESDREQPVEEERKEKPKEEKPRRKSSRIRSSRGKISSRKKKPKAEEPVKPPEEKITETTTISTVISDVEQIDKHIFDEPESQTSKEVDTRAVGNNSGYAKSFQTGKDQDSGKGNRKGEANEYGTSKKHSEFLEKKEEKIDKHFEVKEETTASILNKEEVEEEKKIEKPEEPEAVEEEEHLETSKENISLEEKTSYKEESSMEHENVEDESTTIFSNEDSQGSHEMTKNSRKENKTKFENSSREESSLKQEKIEEEKEEERESHEYSTMKSEEISSQELYDSTESFYENTDEIDTEDDYGSAEDATVSSKHDDSEENPNLKEDEEETREEEEEEEEGEEGEEFENESTQSDQEASTEGVLKFTDELPKDKKEDVPESKKTPESVENIAHDYVDDNYEPDNYKERESTGSNNLSDEKTNKEMLSDDKTETTSTETTTESEDETESPNESSTMDLLQTTTSSTTTTTTTTTAPRPTVPKLFKPISARKNYNYIPPTTTPNPVVIKPRLSLLNPKPAKPPKSYNELAPKPVIRKFTLLARKQTTTMATTRFRDEDSTDTPEVTTVGTTTTTSTTTESPLTTIETSRSEENVLEGKLENQIPIKGKEDQDSSPSEQKSPTNVRREEEEDFTPYPVTRLTTLASTIEKALKEVENNSEPKEEVSTKDFTLFDIEIVSTTALSTLNESENTEEAITTMKSTTEEDSLVSSTVKRVEDSTEVPSTSPAIETTVVAETTTKEAEEMVTSTTRSLRRKSATMRRQDGFNCLEKEMYRFYGDNRDCRLFHYCSPGFTSRQVLDFRFVCEEGTAFDEESQSCSHDVRREGCLRQW